MKLALKNYSTVWTVPCEEDVIAVAAMFGAQFSRHLEGAAEGEDSDEDERADVDDDAEATERPSPPPRDAEAGAGTQLPSRGT